MFLSLADSPPTYRAAIAEVNKMRADDSVAPESYIYALETVSRLFEQPLAFVIRDAYDARGCPLVPRP